MYKAKRKQAVVGCFTFLQVFFNLNLPTQK